MNKSLAFQVSSLAAAKVKAEQNGKIVVVEENNDPMQRFICRNLAQGKTGDYYVMNQWRSADKTNAVFYCAESLSDALAFIRVGMQQTKTADKQEAA